MLTINATNEGARQTDYCDWIFMPRRSDHESNGEVKWPEFQAKVPEEDMGYKMILGKSRYGDGDGILYFFDRRSAVEKSLDRLLQKMAYLLSFVVPRRAAALNCALSRRAERNIRIQAEEVIEIEKIL